jgi:hypothetical protein
MRATFRGRPDARQTALGLALYGRRSAAREMVRRLGTSDEFSAEVERSIHAFDAWLAFEQARVNAALPARRVAS